MPPRSTHHAAVTPITAAHRTTSTERTTVLRSSMRDRWRNSTRWISAHPELWASRASRMSGEQEQDGDDGADGGGQPAATPSAQTAEEPGGRLGRRPGGQRLGDGGVGHRLSALK